MNSAVTSKTENLIQVKTSVPPKKSMLPCERCRSQGSLCASMTYQLFSGKAQEVICEQLKQPS